MAHGSRAHVLLLQYHAVHHQLRADLVTVLLAPRKFYSVLHRPSRIALHPGFCKSTAHFCQVIRFALLTWIGCVVSYSSSRTGTGYLMPSSIATIFITACEYGVPHVGGWLVQTMEVMFWVYVVVAYIASAGMYLILWSTQVGSSRTLSTC